MARLAEFSYQQGDEAQFESYVRSEFPQCIARDEMGEELVPVQYRSAYSHEVGIEYVPALQLDQEDPPTIGNQALMVDWHKEPENSEQSGRIQARVFLVTALAEIPDIPPNQDVRELIQEALASIENSGFVGVAYITVSALVWAGEPIVSGTQDFMNITPQVAAAIKRLNGN